MSALPIGEPRLQDAAHIPLAVTNVACVACLPPHGGLVDASGPVSTFDAVCVWFCCQWVLLVSAISEIWLGFQWALLLSAISEIWSGRYPSGAICTALCCVCMSANSNLSWHQKHRKGCCWLPSLQGCHCLDGAIYTVWCYMLGRCLGLQERSIGHSCNGEPPVYLVGAVAVCSDYDVCLSFAIRGSHWSLPSLRGSVNDWIAVRRSSSVALYAECGAVCLCLYRLRRSVCFLYHAAFFNQTPGGCWLAGVTNRGMRVFTTSLQVQPTHPPSQLNHIHWHMCTPVASLCVHHC